MRTALTLCLALALSGCATIGLVADRICGNAEVSRTGLELALTQAYTIRDDQLRERTIRSINIALSALDHCPR